MNKIRIKTRGRNRVEIGSGSGSAAPLLRDGRSGFPQPCFSRSLARALGGQLFPQPRSLSIRGGALRQVRLARRYQRRQLLPQRRAATSLRAERRRCARLLARTL